MTTETKPDLWDAYWATVGNEDYLYARELIEVTQTIRAHFAGYIARRDDGDVDLDWSAAAKGADEWAASGTERRMLDLVLSLVQPDLSGHHEQREDDEGRYEVWVVTGMRTMNVRDLGSMGSWRDDVAAILARYITGQQPRR